MYASAFHPTKIDTRLGVNSGERFGDDYRPAVIVITVEGGSVTLFAYDPRALDTLADGFAKAAAAMRQANGLRQPPEWVLRNLEATAAA